MLLDHYKFIVKSKTIHHANNKKEFEIVEFETGAQLGTAKNVTGFFPSLLGTAKMEVRDSSTGALVFSVEHKGFLFKKDQILDSQDQPVSIFKSKRFSLSGGYHLYDKDGKHLCEIQGSMFKAEYKFMTPDRASEMGSVSRTWGGLAKSLLSGDDSYGVQVNLAYAENVPVKIMILGAAIALESIFKPAKSTGSSAGASSVSGGEE